MVVESNTDSISSKNHRYHLHSSGRPSPNVTWYLDNSVIDESFENQNGVTLNHLTYPNIGRQHVNARLICMATNTNLTPPNSKIVILDINCKFNSIIRDEIYDVDYVLPDTNV